MLVGLPVRPYWGEDSTIIKALLPRPLLSTGRLHKGWILICLERCGEGVC